MQVRFEGQGKDRLIANLKRPKPTFGYPHGLKYQFGETLTFLQRVDAWKQIWMCRKIQGGALHFRFRPWGSTKKPLSPSDVGRPFVGSPGGHAPRFAVGLVPQKDAEELDTWKWWGKTIIVQVPSCSKTKSCYDMSVVWISPTESLNVVLQLPSWKDFFLGIFLGVDPAGVDWSAAARGRCAQRSGETEPRLDPAICPEGWVVQGSGYGKPMT